MMAPWILLRGDFVLDLPVAVWPEREEVVLQGRAQANPTNLIAMLTI